MTLLASWVAVEPRGIQSMYMASDSCISWKGMHSNSVTQRFLHYKKLYACQKRPEMFGFCGDATFCANVLEQIVNMIDSGVMFKVGYSPQLKAQTILNFIIRNYEDFPKDSLRLPIEILYGFRTKGGKKARFYCYMISCKNSQWKLSEVSLRQRQNDKNISYYVCKMGTGALDLEKEINEYIYKKKNGFSRGMFAAFCNTLGNNITDMTYGGAPQLVGIYRKPDSPAINFGVIYKGKKYISGQEVTNYDSIRISEMEWRNDVFEIVDPVTNQRKEGAKVQPLNA